MKFMGDVIIIRFRRAPESKDNIRNLLPDTSIVWLVGELEGRSRFDRVIDTTN